MLVPSFPSIKAMLPQLQGWCLTWLISGMLLLAFIGQQIVSLDTLGLSHGFSHPLTGWDHLLTMLAVGIWAAQMRGHAVWQLPLAFVSMMSLGGVAGASGLNIPSVEGIILLSCAVFSVLITRKIWFSPQINSLIVAFFAFFHGFAHGQEISASASLISYTLGFMLATLLLHGAGILLAKLLVLAVSGLFSLVLSQSVLAANADLSFNSASSVIKADDFSPLSLLAEPKPGLQLASGKSADRQLMSIQRQDRLASSVTLLSNGLFDTPAIPGSDWVFATDVATGLSFRGSFPQINHTPGRFLFSNGVGLTSPPLLVVGFSAVSSAVLSSLAFAEVSVFRFLSSFKLNAYWLYSWPRNSAVFCWFSFLNHSGSLSSYMRHSS